MAASVAALSPVLITGGCGFIGSHLARRLLEDNRNCKIHVLDVDTSRRRIAAVDYHACDISNADDVDRVMQEAQPRTVFHIACPDSMVIRPELFERVDVVGTRNLLASAARLGTVRALVNVSTSSVIHDNRSDLIDADETLPVLRPPVQKRIYTLTKATAESDILAANRAAGDASMLTVSMRPATAFGEDDDTCLGKMVAVAQQGKTRFQMGDGKNVFDFIYIDNLVEAHVLAARALVAAYGKPPTPPDRRVDGECFNVTNDEPVLFWEFSRKIAAAAGRPVRPEDIVVIPVWIGLVIGWLSEWLMWIQSWGTSQPNMTREGIRFSTINRTLNGAKAKRVLRYRPKVSMDEGIERSVRWYVERGRKENCVAR